MPDCALPLRKEVLPQENLTGRGGRKERELSKQSLVGTERRNQPDLLSIYPDFAQHLCKQADWGKRIFA